MNNTIHIIDIYCDTIQVKGFCCILEFVPSHKLLTLNTEIHSSAGKITPSLLIVRDDSENITNLIFEQVMIKSEPENVQLDISKYDREFVKPINLSGFSYLGMSYTKCWFVKIVRT